MERTDGDVAGLVNQATSGDPAALQALLARYLPELEGYMHRHVGAVLAQKESRSDLLQSVCREVLEDLADGGFQWRGEGPFRQWLYRTALSKIQTKARFHAAQRRAHDREQPLADDPADDPGLHIQRTPSMSAADAEEHERFRRAMAGLPADQRQLVEWAHFEGMSHKEIARRLGISEANSRMMLSRALAQLAKIATRTS